MYLYISRLRAVPVYVSMHKTKRKAHAMQTALFSTRKVGGVRFVKLGRFCFSFCVSSHSAPIGSKPPRQRKASPHQIWQAGFGSGYRAARRDALTIEA